MKKIYCFVLCLFPVLSGAQAPPPADTALASVLLMPDDTAKVNRLMRLADTYVNRTREQRFAAATAGLEFVEKLRWNQGYARAWQMLGRAYWEKGMFDRAKELHLKALQAFREQGNKKRIAVTLHFLGQDYADAGDYSTALDYLEQALQAYGEVQNYQRQAAIHNIMTWVYVQLGMQPQAMQHNYASLEISEKIGDQYMINLNAGNLAVNYIEKGEYRQAIAVFRKCIQSCLARDDMSNVSIYYAHIADCYHRLKAYDEALKHYMLSLETARQTGHPADAGLSYAALGQFHRSRGDWEKALEAFRNSATACGAANQKQSRVMQYLNMAGCYTQLRNIPAARAYYQKVLPEVLELQSTNMLNHYYRGMATVDSASGHWKGAFDHFRLYVQARDSMYNEENTRKIVQSRMQYEFDKKEAATKAEQEKKDALAKAELHRQKILRNGFMGGFAAVLAFAGIFFYQRNRIKKGKQRSDELLLNILPVEVAEELKVKGSAEARLIDEVTVLFSDFKGFTQLSEQLAPAELVAEINTCFSEFDHIMQRHNVEKIKTIGDAYMAAGGLPLPNTTHAADVVGAALDMQAYMLARYSERQAAGLFAFEIRIGANTGPVVAGIVGIKKFAYDIWGDTVNTAQRMESSSEAGKVNISGSTYERVKDRFHCTYRGRVDTKGKGEVDMYFVEG